MPHVDDRVEGGHAPPVRPAFAFDLDRLASFVGLACVSLAVGLAGCQAPGYDDYGRHRPAPTARDGRPDLASDEALEASAEIEELAERHTTLSLRRLPLEERERRTREVIALLEGLLDRLAGLRDDPVASARLSTDAWRAMIAAGEVGRDHLRDLRDLEADLARPMMGIKPSPYRVGPAMRAHLGLSDNQGFLVDTIESGSPAARLGIEPGDVIVSIDEAPIRDLDVLWMRYEALAPGEKISLEWFHQGERRRAEIVR